MVKRNVRLRTGNKRVVIALQMAGKPGQRKMSGILDYLAEKDLRWELRFVRHREDFSPDFGIVRHAVEYGPCLFHADKYTTNRRRRVALGEDGVEDHV